MPAPFLKLCAISKAFSGVAALKGVDLQVSAGEVLGLMGENGAGKSTLIKILSGLLEPDSGSMELDGRPLSLESSHAAMDAGIATIHQEVACFNQMTVAENLLLGEVWPRLKWGGTDRVALHELARRQLASFDLDLAPESLFSSLSAAQKQEVAIARALARDSRLLILDEPTASLGPEESRRLFDKLRKLQSNGLAILFVSHRIEEVLSLCNQVLVLRDGQAVANYPRDEATSARLIKDMIGRPLDQVFPRSTERCPGKVVLQIKGASCRGLFENISMQLRAGEIVGLGGLIGAGRSELARAIYGLYPMDEGQIELHGKAWRPSGPDESLRSGLVYLPEERKRHGLVLEHSVSENISIGLLDRLSKWGLVRRSLEKQCVGRAVESLDIRMNSPLQSVGTLSGGNQQKALLGRWLERDPEILILDEPTRGVDVGAKAAIHELIDQLAVRGKAILLISSDLPELLGLSDRVLFMREGRLASEMDTKSMTQEDLFQAATNLFKDA